jgi:ectoine hydroxylase-related dioxygenase (phytanoyl-CoA dioxygenase family)
MFQFRWNKEPKCDLQDDGVVVVRKAVDRKLIKAFLKNVNYAYERVKNPETELEKAIADSSAQWGGIAIDHIQNLATDRDAALQLFNHIVAQLAAALTKESGRTPTFQSPLSYTRRHINERNQVAATSTTWHIDAYAAGTISQDPVCNAWMPLVPVGRTQPSLEFIPGTHIETRAGKYSYKDEGRPNDAGYPDFDWIGPKMAAGHHACFVLKPGDIVIFDHWLPHRTQVAAFPAYVRTSAEMRFSLG